jgi:CDGSH-type Zn-finger protein
LAIIGSKVGREPDASNLVTVEEPARITPYRDGPYIVRGNFVVTDQEGNEIDARRRTIALCRCGRSQMRPFCDGTHKLIGFRAPGGEEDPDL